MTTLQIQACRLIEQLPEEKLTEVVDLLYKLTFSLKNNAEHLAEQDAERLKRLAAIDELRKAREKLISMNIDWETELEEAMREKYGV